MTPPARVRGTPTPRARALLRAASATVVVAAVVAALSSGGGREVHVREPCEGDARTTDEGPILVLPPDRDGCTPDRDDEPERRDETGTAANAEEAAREGREALTPGARRRVSAEVDGRRLSATLRGRSGEVCFVLPDLGLHRSCEAPYLEPAEDVLTLVYVRLPGRADLRPPPRHRPPTPSVGSLGLWRGFVAAWS